MSNNPHQEWIQQATQFYMKGDLAKASVMANKVFNEDPNNPHAIYILGMISSATGRDRLAVSLLEQAIALKPDHPYYHFHLGSILQGQAQLDRAEEAYLEALRLRPDFTDAMINLGNLYIFNGDPEKGKQYYYAAIYHQPDHVTALLNLGIMAQEEGDCETSLIFFDRALLSHPNSANVRMARAFSLLMLERFSEGWKEYEWRWKMDNLSPRICPKPRWQGEPLEGKSLYVYTEQGFGDALMFCRYLERVRALGARVHLECKPELYRLFALSNLADLLYARPPDDPHPPPFDYDLHLPMLSLPGFFTDSLETIPNHHPYLKADPETVLEWKERLGSAPGLKVGLCWSGNPGATANRNRACTLENLFSLTRVAHVRFFSLQKGDPARQLRFLDREGVVENLDAELNDFADTAALLMNLDLLISTDTAVVHLAGALGVPTWTLLHTASEWRWLRHRQESPWYPRMRLFRQTQPQDWASVVHEIHGELERLAAQTCG